MKGRYGDWSEEAKKRHRSRTAKHHRTVRGKVAQNRKKRVVRTKRRLRMIQELGGKCVCCGESRHEFLTLDHIHGGGRRERLSKDGGPSAWMAWRQGYPASKYRILCWNCNCAIGVYGACPHQEVQK